MFAPTVLRMSMHDDGQPFGLNSHVLYYIILTGKKRAVLRGSNGGGHIVHHIFNRHASAFDILFYRIHINNTLYIKFHIKLFRGKQQPTNNILRRYTESNSNKFYSK